MYNSLYEGTQSEIKGEENGKVVMEEMFCGLWNAGNLGGGG